VNWVFLAGLALLVAAAAAGLLAVRPSWARGLPYLLGGAGSACLAVTGGVAIAGHLVSLGSAGWLGEGLPGQQAPSLAADRLSGLFLLMAFGAAVPVSLAFASWAYRNGGTRMMSSGYALALGAVAVVMTGRDAFTLLLGWEALTAAFYLLAGADWRDPDRGGAARLTVSFGKVSGAALLIGLLLLAGKSHSIDLASFAHVTGAAGAAAEVLLIGGFAVKAGLVPFQVWMPRGYAAAPGPARAIMAGVCVNVAFYGMWRTLSLLGHPPGWLGGVLLILGGLTALLGIAHAAVQNRLSRVIAYSSVENSGLIITGFGVAVTGAAVGNRTLVAAGLLAATLQMIMHTAAKSLLFVSAAGLEDTTGAAGDFPGGYRDDMEALRGAGRRAPWSGLGLAIGSVTLAGLPPTAGFVSEWFLLESLMQQFRVDQLGGRLTLALAGAAVALTAGFAGVTFVRLAAMTVLTRGDGPRSAPAAAPLSANAIASHASAEARDYGLAGRVGVLALAVCPLALSAVTPLEIRVIAAGLSPVLPSGTTTGALKSPWVVQPVFAGFSALSPSWLWIEIPLMLVAVGLLTFALSGKRMVRVRRVPAWRSATIGVEGADSYTAFGYANPTRRVLASVLHTRSDVEEITSVARGAMTNGAPANGTAEAGGPSNGAASGGPHLRYASDVVEVVESWLYRPAARLFERIVAVAKRLQSGRLDAYLLYMLIALIALVAVVLALAG
jgi:formate hydrogenlyase subunit 3/multisubunit Na+/H+ antiporter MnhD subunit